MTTVLARPLGGYGLTPLIFEPSTTLLGLSSNSIETKVRKSPVFEVLMPNYDDEPGASFPIEEAPKAKPAKKMDYESLISKRESDKTVSLPSTNSYFSASGMLGLFGPKHNSLYDESIPSYKEQISRSDFAKSSHSTSYHQPYSSAGPSGPVNAAVQSVRSVEVKDVQNSYQNAEPQVIDIPPSALPIIINFRTSSSQIQVHQSHESQQPIEHETTQSEGM